MPLRATAAEQVDRIDHRDGREPSQDAGLATSNSEPETSGGAGASSKSPDTARCSRVDAAAVRYGVPPEFFRRLIQLESDFDPKAISRAGAIGIAQYMPDTARWRGVGDPFDPTEALDGSARWLSGLRRQFGNLGLAAAAYNAGPRRIRDWIDGRGQLPRETRAYVRAITGRSAEEWLPSSARQAALDPSVINHCAPDERPVSAKLEEAPEQKIKRPGWVLRLVGNASEVAALAEYDQLRSRFRSVLGDHAPIVIRKPLGGRVASAWPFVSVGEVSRESATQLCSRLRSAGGSCLVAPN